MAKSVNFRWSDEFVATIDEARGDVSRSKFVQRAIREKLERSERLAYMTKGALGELPDVVPEIDRFKEMDRQIEHAIVHGDNRRLPKLFAGAGSPVDVDRHVQISPKLAGGVKPRPKGKR